MCGGSGFLSLNQSTCFHVTSWHDFHLDRAGDLGGPKWWSICHYDTSKASCSFFLPLLLMGKEKMSSLSIFGVLITCIQAPEVRKRLRQFHKSKVLKMWGWLERISREGNKRKNPKSLFYTFPSSWALATASWILGKKWSQCTQLCRSQLIMNVEEGERMFNI